MWVMPSCTQNRAMASASSKEAVPSSIPGRIWQCRSSIKPLPCRIIADSLRESETHSRSECATLLLQSIHPHRIIVEQFPLLLRAAAVDNRCQRLEPLLERRRLRTDRPIAAEHHAIGTEYLQCVLDDRRQIVGRPALRRGRHDDTGYLAHHIFAFGNGGDVLFPLRTIFRLHVAVAAMIEDKPRIGTFIDQLRRVQQFAWPHTQIETQIALAE